MKILVRAPNWLGDSVMSIPAICGIKKLFPNADIFIYAKSDLAGLWQFIPGIRRVLSIEDGLGPVLKEKFDLVILLTNSFGSVLRMFCTRIPERRGYSRNMRRFLLTQPVHLKNGWKNIHQIEYFLGLLNELDKSYILKKENNTVPQIDIPLDLDGKAEMLLKKYDWEKDALTIGIHATASYGPAKCWLPERFSQLMQELKTHYDSWILIFGGKDEEDAVAKILQNVPNKEKIINLAGKTNIMQLAAIIKKCKLFISNDSGPMHLAGAVGIPVIGIFGSTDPKKTGPRGKVIIIKKDIDCSPCLKRVCPTELECMDAISVNDVMEKVRELIL